MSMAFIMHTDGLTYVVQTAFTEEQSAPANFYIGLCNDTLVLGDTLATLAGELSGGGYARQTVASDGTDITDAADGDGWRATFKEVTFAADGADWAEVNTWFIATSADNSGKLIASGPISPAKTLLDGSSFDLTTYITVANSA
jgi:hypothetical protein